MATPLRALIVDDSEDDALLLAQELRRGGFEVASVRVDTADAMGAALAGSAWDVVLADWRMPHFSAPAALAVAKDSCPDLPFIIVSGMIGEETAVGALKAGADDFMLKDNLSRLVPAIRRAIRDGEARRERRRAEAALVDSETRFRSLIDGSSDLILVLAADGTVRYVSPSIKRLLGHEAEQRVGRSLYELAHAEDAPRIREVLRSVVALGGQIERIEWRASHRDGGWRTMESVGTNLLAVPSVAGIVVNSRDITERVQLERQLRQAQKMEALGQLAGGVAHDFNNLLTVIHANVGLLAAELPDDVGGREEFKGLQRAAVSGQAIVKSLLGFARQQAPELIPTDLGAAMEEIATTLRHLLPETVEIKVELARPFPAVRADEGSLEQILINLGTNARDAMPDGGTLTIGVAGRVIDDRDAGAASDVAPGRYVAVTVRDTGEGMEEATRRRAHEPLFTTKPAGQGTGLGLSIVFELVARHGGQIRLASERGRGTTVELLFPAIDAPVVTGRGPERVRESRPGAGETILVVEDDEELRRAACRILNRFGYRTLEAANGEAGLAAYRTARGAIDLIFTDLVMPRLGGMALLERIRAGDPGMRFLIASGYTSAEARDAGLRAGVPFINKPWTLPELLERVREALAAPVKEIAAVGSPQAE